MVFGVSRYALFFLNRNPTLTDRTVLWAQILKVNINPIFGVGFESFWMGDRLEQLHEGFIWQPNESHNGYLETYINLGAIGLLVLVGLLVATFFTVRRGLLTDFEFGRFQLGLLVVVVLYNWTEVSFRGPHPLWLLFYIIAIDYPKRRLLWSEPALDPAEPEAELEVGYADGNAYERAEQSRYL